MNNCLNCSNCNRLRCTEACTVWAEIDYLKKRNSQLNWLQYESKHRRIILRNLKKLQNSEKFIGVKENCSVSFRDSMVEEFICQYYIKNDHFCSVYSLNFGSYLLGRASDKFGRVSRDQVQIWACSDHTKMLIINGLDYITFGIDEVKQLLDILNIRSSNRLHTLILLSNKISDLGGYPKDVSRLQQLLGGHRL